MSIFDIFRKGKKTEPQKIIDAEALGLDPLFEDAAWLVLKMSYYSESSLQRKLKIGYNRALRIEDELENVGIIGPVINPMVPREILINDERKLEDVLRSIRDNGFQQDGQVCIITDEETKRKVDEIKQRTIEINSFNYQEFCPFDIVAFSYGQEFAKWKGFYIITINGDVYHAHSEMNIVELFTICPPLSQCKFGVRTAEATPEDYSYFYMGAGNHLFVNDIISNEVKGLCKWMDKIDLYQQWKYVVLQALEKYKAVADGKSGNWADLQKSTSKLLTGKAFFITQFRGGWDNEWPEPMIVFLSKGKMRSVDDLFFYNSKNEVPREIRGGSGTVKISTDKSIEGPIGGETDGEMSGRLLVAAGFKNFWFYEIDFSKIDSSIDEFRYIILNYQNAFGNTRKMLSFPFFKIKAIGFPVYYSNKKDYYDYLSDMVPQIIDDNNCLLYDSILYKDDFNCVLVGSFIRVNSTDWRYEAKWEPIDFKDYLGSLGFDADDK